MTRKDAAAPDPTAIGDVSSPPFARLPNTASLFATRATRFSQLAEASGLAPYLNFLAGLTTAQHLIQADLPPAESPDAATLLRAYEFEMPPLHGNRIEDGEAIHAIFDRLFAVADAIEKPAAAAEALARVTGADREARLAMAETVLSGSLPAEAVAEHIFVWAALQVQFARLASVLHPSTLRPVADGICPVCGGRPASSMVVGWPGSHGARFCCCSLCSTLWHHVRIKCVLCGSTKGIAYREIENHGGTVKAETCDECHGWTKIFYQNKAPATEPIADDVASLSLDLLMREGPYRRGGFAPLLAGI